MVPGMRHSKLNTIRLALSPYAILLSCHWSLDMKIIALSEQPQVRKNFMYSMHVCTMYTYSQGELLSSTCLCFVIEVQLVSKILYVFYV